MRLLVSVRTVDEAQVAARGGADFIDLKEPRAGALGGLPVSTLRSIVRALRASRVDLPVSATIGDLPMDEIEQIVEQVGAVGACEVDYVKVGIEPVRAAWQVLETLAGTRWPVVPVFIADRGLDMAQVEYAAGLRFPALMVDTADKVSGSLFDVLPLGELRRFIEVVRKARALAGLAGALRLSHVPLLAALAPDFAGFRSAVCAADRGSELDPTRLQRLAECLHTRAVVDAA